MVYAALMISLYTMSHYNGLCCLYMWDCIVQWTTLNKHRIPGIAVVYMWPSFNNATAQCMIWLVL